MLKTPYQYLGFGVAAVSHVEKRQGAKRAVGEGRGPRRAVWQQNFGRTIRCSIRSVNSTCRQRLELPKWYFAAAFAQPSQGQRRISASNLLLPFSARNIKDKKELHSIGKRRFFGGRQGPQKARWFAGSLARKLNKNKRLPQRKKAGPVLAFLAVPSPHLSLRPFFFFFFFF